MIKLEVTLLSPKITTDEITFRLPKTVPGTYSTDDYGRYLSDFKAFDSKGNELTASKLDVNSYTIKDAKKLFKISYKIDDTWDSPEIKGTKISSQRVQILWLVKNFQSIHIVSLAILME